VQPKFENSIFKTGRRKERGHDYVGIQHNPDHLPWRLLGRALLASLRTTATRRFNIPHLEFVEAFSFGFRLDMLQPRRTGRDRINVVFHAHDDHAWLTAALDNESFHFFALRVS
jgi:hypothetical protein